jgi:hypothetical protein
MKRSWNWFIWVGFLCVLAALLSYPFFVLFPITRDFPWANLLLFCAGGILLVGGLLRAFGKPKLYRGRIFGPIVVALSLAAFSLFAYGVFYVARQLPSSTAAPHIGQKAPDFTLPDQNGKPVALADLLASPPDGATSGAANGALLIFYRGHW